MKTSITMAVSSALIGLSSAQCKYGQVVSEDDINTIVPLDVCIAKLDGSNKAHVYSCHEDGTLLKQSFTTYNCAEGTNDGGAVSSDELTDFQCTEDAVCDYYHVYEFLGVADTACGTLETADLNEQGEGGISSRFFMSRIFGGELNVCVQNSGQTGFEQGAVTSDYCDADIAVTGPAVTVTTYSDAECSTADANIAAPVVFELTDENTKSLYYDDHDNRCRYFAGCSSALTANTASYERIYGLDDDEYYAERGDAESYAGDDAGSVAGDYAESYAEDDTESDADVTIDGHSTGGDDDGSDDGDDTTADDTGYHSSTCKLIGFCLIIALLMVFGCFIID